MNPRQTRRRRWIIIICERYTDQPCPWYYYCCNDYVAKWKTSQKKKTLTSQLSGSVIGSNRLIYSKSRAWCHSFQPTKEHNLCFVVCCLLFSIIVDQQHEVSNSITAQSNNINSKQLSKSQVDPWVVKQFRWECLWHHVQALTQNQTFLAT